jgi:glycosyltransferase involved in cell wall biosynthesis
MMLCDEYPPGRHGGIGTVVQLLARAYVRQGHNVIVAGLYDWGYGQKDHFDDLGVTVYRFRFGLANRRLQNKDSLGVRIAYRLLRISGILQKDITKSISRYHKQLEALISKHKIDIVEMPDFQEYMQYVKRLTTFPKLSVPVVVKLHGSVTYFLKEACNEVPEPIYRSELQLLNNATAIASVSAYTSVKTAAYFHYSRPIDVLHNGIESSDFAVTEKDPNLVLFTGSLVEKKGIYQLMKAWNIVHQKRPQSRLQVYGKGPVAKIKELLTQDARNSVEFKGHVSRADLYSVLSKSTAAVFPSYAECFALGPMEAMGCNTAVIYTLRSSGPELIDDGKDGLLIDPDKPEEIAKKILYLLENKDVALVLADKGRKKIERDFSIDYIAARHIAYYQQILSSK